VGVHFCVPFFGCTTIGSNPSPGGDGQNGPDIINKIVVVSGGIQTVTDGLAGITEIT
jgi:hypothetical protein